MIHLDTLVRRLRAHMTEVREQARKDGGYTTETIVITAVLAILALGVVGVIVSKVTAKANGISLD
ncbi:hypothetical protein [Streptomyces sp. NPDC002851]